MLNENDHAFAYNLTIGDIKKWRIMNPNSNKIEEIWFPMEKSVFKCIYLNLERDIYIYLKYIGT